MKAFLISLLILIGSTQYSSTWITLSKVKIERKFDPSMNFEVDYPTFSEEILALNGKEITLEGWMIPLDELRGENYFVLSALPFANCFFCGGAGPETVMEVFTDEKVEFEVDRIKVKGRLRLNATDPMQLMYILNDAEIVD
jgi:hypothetical protein